MKLGGGDGENSSVGSVVISEIFAMQEDFFLDGTAPFEGLHAVKCYPGGRKIHLIPSISEILLQTCYHCVQYTRRHLMSLISHC